MNTDTLEELCSTLERQAAIFEICGETIDVDLHLKASAGLREALAEIQRLRSDAAVLPEVLAEPLVREMMADRAQWRGSASDLLQVGTTGLANQRLRGRWPAGCAGHGPSCAHLGLKLLRPRGALGNADHRDNGHG